MGDADIFALASHEGVIGIQAFFIRGGQNWGHRSFFPAAHHVAHVVDPVRREEGAFGWRDGHVVALATRPAPAIDPAARPATPP